MATAFAAAVLSAAGLAFAPVPAAHADIVTATIPTAGGSFGVDITPDGTRAYVTQMGENSVAVIDTAANAVTATIPVGTQPAGVAITGDGTHAYVANVGNYKGPDGNPIAGNGTVSVIDTATNAVRSTFPVGGYPFGVEVSPNGAHVYVTHVELPSGNGAVSVIDTATNTVTATIPVGSVPKSVAFTPDGSRAYITNQASNSVSVIDTVTNTVTATIQARSVPEGIAITPDGVQAYVTNYDGTVSVIDTATNTVTATVSVPVYSFNVAITPDGARAYVANNIHSSVSVIDTATNTVTGTVTVGAKPWATAITPDGTHAYVTHQDNATVSVIAIDQAPTLAGTPPAGAAGKPYHHSFTIAGQPAPTVAVTAGALPNGLTLTPAGVLSGTPSTGGRYEVTVTATNGIGRDAVFPVVLEIEEAPPAAGSLGSFGS